MFKELDITLEMPNIDKDKYFVKCHLSGYEETDTGAEWRFAVIGWKTYCDAVADDIHHKLYDVWITTSSTDMLDMLDELKQFFNKF